MGDKPFTKQQLEALVCDVMHIKSITPTMRRQITNLVLVEKMTYLEIARCIVFYDEELHGKFEPIYGLSFVHAVRDRAAAHFARLAQEQQQQVEQAQKITEYQENNIVFNIHSLEHKRRQARQLDISEINVKGDSNND